MDIFLAVLASICLLVGLAGAVLPLPGPPLSFVGLLLLHYSKYAEFDKKILWSFGLATLIVTVVDYYVPIWGTKKFGGSKYGTWGSTIGLIIGLFMGPLGIFVGAFAGAMVGELIGGSDSKAAFKAALGSFVGFLAGIFMKVVLCLFMIYQAFIAVF
jgi:uncharacterized protein YqgC (DUF456 family)